MPIAGGKPRTCRVVGHRHARGRDLVERHIAGARGAGLRQAHDPQHARGVRLHGRTRRLANRPLQHQRARVIGDATHDVEATGGTRDDDLTPGLEQPACGFERMHLERLDQFEEPRDIKASEHGASEPARSARARNGASV